jgi:hypothetical protein
VLSKQNNVERSPRMFLEGTTRSTGLLFILNPVVAVMMLNDLQAPKL